MSRGAIFATSLLVGLALQPMLIPWLRRRGVMDIPNERSSHVTITPRGGGIAVVTALGTGLLLGRQGGWDVGVVLLGALALGAVGLTDDFRGLSAKVRLGILLLVGVLAALLLVSPLPLVLAVPVLAVWSAAFVNAFNFMDGINGISGLSGLVAGVAYSLMGSAVGSPALVAIGAALAGACLSFLPFNLLRARVFLGDVGSYALGFVIAASAWLAWACGAPLLLALAPTSVLLVDTGSTLCRRARNGEPLMEAHRSHVYQRLVAGGYSHLSVALLVAGAESLVVALTWWTYSSGHAVVGVALTVGVLSAYLISPSLLSCVEVHV